MEVDATRKKRTDCVYFLASRLTCKKGNECEFRHSERARLNPRDCYYWLQGNCLNLDCGFRHPPLERITESAINMAQFSAHSGYRTTKSNAPCRYYLSSQCRNGDQCAFLHDAASVHKLPNAALEHTTVYPLEMTISYMSPIPSEISEMNNLSQSETVQQLAGGSALEETAPSQESSVPEFKKTAINDSPFLAAECSNNSSRNYSPDQNSEKTLTKSDDKPESSAGFDKALKRESELYHNRLGYADRDSLYNNARHDSYEHLHSPERALDSASHRKRRLSGMESDANDEGGVDLRNRSRKQRRMDDHQANSHNSCGHHSSWASGSSRVQTIRHETGLLHHGKNKIGLSQDENESVQTAPQRRGLSECPQPISHARLRSEIGMNMIGLPHAETEDVQSDCHRNAESRNTKRRSKRQQHDYKYDYI